jgi:hypothetical protein
LVSNNNNGTRKRRMVMMKNQQKVKLVVRFRLKMMRKEEKIHKRRMRAKKMKNMTW